MGGVEDGDRKRTMAGGGYGDSCGIRNPQGHHRPLSTSTTVIRPARDGAVADDVNLTRWSSLSVKVAMAVMSTGGDEAIARRAKNAVLEAGDDARTLRGRVEAVSAGAGGTIDACKTWPR